MKEIIFWNNSNVDLDAPKPANKDLPEWYKNTNAYINGKNNFTVESVGISSNSTIKKCMPVFDALTTGYLLYTPSDLYIEHIEGQAYYKWERYGEIRFHPRQQAELHPFVRQGQNFVAKFANLWGIQTSPGFSCIFLPPMHRDNQINILPGIVDTDVYHLPIEFPFILKDYTFEGLIPAGTPIAQVIPIKRETWKSVKKIRTPEERDKLLYSVRKFFINAYKNTYWQKKKYE